MSVTGSSGTTINTTSSSGGRGGATECRKFAPNIFNKSKCSSCFKQKEEHSAEALECNRATRKISKCGYLFVAPGWDFTNPLNRTKRWQRRWFVLYDDGELTYSVDEHPETVPQSRIDMTRVLEVAAAEDITGHPYSLAVTAPEGVTFVKGTCREETRWWADVLQVYPRNKGRHKRNATFPGGQATILQVSPGIRSNTPNPPRPRFNSCRSEPRVSSNPSWIPEAELTSPKSVANCFNGIKINANLENGAVVTSKQFNNTTSSSSSLTTTTTITTTTNSTNVKNNSPITTSATTINNSSSSSSSLGVSNVNVVGADKPPIGPSESRQYRDHPASSASPPTRDKLRAEDKARRRMNQGNDQHRSLSSNSSSTNSSSLVANNQTNSNNNNNNAVNVSNTEKLDDEACRRILLEHEREREGKLRDIAASLTQPRVRRNKPRTSEPTRDVVDAANAAHQDKLIRGDPDGCGLDISGTRYSPTSELRVDLPAEDLLNIKKGWLMKQSVNKEWNKHWFVLRGCGLMYYRDPSAEDKGIMDGVIDLNTVTAITPVLVARNYGFQTVTWDDRGTTVLSAVTAGIRSSWMSAIGKAANILEPEINAESRSSCQENQQETDPQSPTTSINDRERDSMVPSTPLTPRSVLFSSDEEYRTASEGGRRESGDWSEMPISPPLTRNGEWALALKGSNWPDQINHEWSELPPSPPLTRTALSRVKARSRSSSRSRGYKRSRSSPPSSRRSTLDSVRSEDLMMACCELGEDEEQSNNILPNNVCLTNNTDNNPLIVELLESQVSMLRDQLDQNQSHPSSLLVVIERQENEIEELKSQLNEARNEISGAEKELARLRQQKIEASIRDKQVDELLNTIQRTEQQRNKDLEDLDKVKKLYNRDKEILECKLLETEAILRETAERCEMITNELSSSHMTVEHLQNEISTLSDRLSQGIEENEQLYARVRELEGRSGLSAARERGRSFDSLSDLTNIDMDLDLKELDKERMIEEYEELRGRFEKAISEIRAMRRELRDAHATQDALELEILAHRQDAARCRDTNQAQVQLMAARIQDLTNKLSASEKQVRSTKQKLLKAESRDKRRSLSLKGRESFQISQELEEKLLELENKICAIEHGKFSSVTPSSTATSSKESSPNPKKERKRENKSLDRARIRRKSLDSATSSEPMKVLIRLSTLETKVAAVSESVTSDVEKDSSECSDIITTTATPTPSNDISIEILSRLRKFERAVVKSKRRLERCLGSTQAEEKAEKCLREVNDILESCGECKKNQASAQVTESVGIVVSRLESILKDKLIELTERRITLEANGKLDAKEKLKLIAERIAFEYVVIGQLKCAIGGKRSFDKCSVLSEFVETSQLISNLKYKVRGTKPKIYQNTSYVKYLTRVLANKLVLVGGVASSTIETSKDVSAARCESFSFLLHQQTEISDIVDRYKESKLNQLASALAAETLSMSEQEDINNKTINTNTTKLLEDRRIREAWALAQETVSKELVRSEVSHVMTKCGQDYEQNITSVSDFCLNFDTSERTHLESWADAAQSRLRQEMEICIEELSNAYEDCLSLMKRNKISSESKYQSRQLLVEFADVIAHKALIDARIDTLQDNTKLSFAYPGETFVSSLIESEDILRKLMGDDCTFESDPHLDAEYTYLFNQYSKDCEERIFGKQQSKEQLKSMAQSLAYLEEEVANLGKSLCGDKIDASLSNWTRSNSSNWDWSNINEKLSELRKRVKRLSDYAQGFSCKQCNQLQETIQRLRAEHNDELVELRRNQEKDLIDIKGELDNQRYSLTSQYEHEAATLRERARKLENRLNAMDSEHSAHVNELRAAYQRSISAELDTDAETRKRYKEEIKQLRGLCEKGLLAMENSHRRIISEMEEKHRQELESLRLEKEQALSEETQATLAALDAMRKAHEHEVQKEITKFKQEFIKQMQAREDIGALHKEHEEEMEEIKQEILSLSSKYSSKCVESAALEERVGSLAKQLSQAQQHIMQLDARNKQLRAHIVSETNDLEINESVQLLRGRDNEIAQQREEIHRLQQQLKHGDQTPRQSSSGPSKSPSLDYSPAYNHQQIRSSLDPVLRANSEDSKLSNMSPKSSSSLQKMLNVDKPAPFSYKLERIRSISLPYTNDLIRQQQGSSSSSSLSLSLSSSSNQNSPKHDNNNKKDNLNFCQTNKERNAINSPLWDSLRPRSGLPHQYQGGTTAMRISSSDDRWQESKQQSEKQQYQEAYTIRANSRHHSSHLTPEPTALSVAELTRSPSVRWSGRSCRSLPPTPTPTYHHPLHPPLPAVGMVAERKKRFEL